MTDKPYTFADLRTIVPAATPAWIRVIEVYVAEQEDKSLTKEWTDEVIPVLAYATLPNGEGAFLIYYNDRYPSGPTWVTRYTGPDRYTDSSKVRIELSVGNQPIKGASCEITEGHKYVSTDVSPFEPGECLWWVL
jgi:hypothetical protein